MLDAWTIDCPNGTTQYTLNSRPDGTVFTVQLEGEIIVHTSFAQGALNREQVEQRCTDVTD
jgi:hypothetical protein